MDGTFPWEVSETTAMIVFWLNLPAEWAEALGIALGDEHPESSVPSKHIATVREALATDGIVLEHVVDDPDDGDDPVGQHRGFAALVMLHNDGQTLQATMGSAHAANLALALSLFSAAEPQLDDASGDGAGDIHCADVVRGQGWDGNGSPVPADS